MKKIYVIDLEGEVQQVSPVEAEACQRGPESSHVIKLVGSYQFWGTKLVIYVMPKGDVAYLRTLLGTRAFE